MCRGNFVISILFLPSTLQNETRVNYIRRASRERRACAYELALCVTYVRREATHINGPHLNFSQLFSLTFSDLAPY